MLMTGFATNCCVETTTRHEPIKGYYIVLVSDGTDTYTQGVYDATLHNIRNYFDKVSASDEIAALWKWTHCKFAYRAWDHREIHKRLLLSKCTY